MLYMYTDTYAYASSNWTNIIKDRGDTANTYDFAAPTMGDEKPWGCGLRHETRLPASFQIIGGSSLGLRCEVPKKIQVGLWQHTVLGHVIFQVQHGGQMKMNTFLKILVFDFS